MAGQALRGEPLRALRAQLPFQGSHGRCWLQHTLQETYASPERGGGPPLGGGEVRPRRQRCGVAVVAVSGRVLHWSKQRPPRQRM